MNLATDERARVPFAVIGVVLLLGSATYAATVAQRDAGPTRPRVLAAEERVDAAIDTAVRRGIASGARAAAHRPVVTPATTRAGRVLGPENTFRNYLRLRIYRSVVVSLDRVNVRVGAVSARATLAPLADLAGLDRAVAAVHLVDGAPNGSIRVRVEGITRELRRRGRVVDRESVNVTRTVATPVLALHERVQRYERRLDRPPLEGPGLGRRLAGTLNALAWTRGYLQYGGLPIENVVGNRHVTVLTNEALLAQQRAVFGTTDPAGRRALRWATADALVDEVLAASDLPTDEELFRRLGIPRNEPVPGGLPGVVPDRASVPAPADTVTVSAAEAVDSALASVRAGRDDGPSLERVLSAVYGADVRVRARRRDIVAVGNPHPDPPAGNWTLVGERRSQRLTVSTGHAPLPTTGNSWHRLDSFRRRVRVENTAVRTWRGDRPGNRTRTSASWFRIVAVGIALEGRHSRTAFAPPRTIEVVHERGGPLDGPNLAGVEERARARLVGEADGVDALVRAAIEGELDTTPVRVRGSQPPELREWLSPTLVALAGTLRNTTTRVPRMGLATGRANPWRRLAERIRSRRADLVDAPRSYGSVAGKAAIAARGALVDAVIERLERRAREADARRRVVDSTLADRRTSLDAAASVLELDVGRPAGRRPMLADGLAGPVAVGVASTPAYLTRRPVDGDRFRAIASRGNYSTLAVRNVNVFTAPYGEAATGVVGELLASDERVNLRVAGRALLAADRTLATTDAPGLRAPRDRLQEELDRSLGVVRDRVRRAVEEHTDLGERAARAAVSSGLARWSTRATTALAIANRSAVDGVVSAVRARTRGSPADVVRLRATLRAVVDEALTDSKVRVPRSVVAGVATERRRATRALRRQLVAAGVEWTSRRVEDRLGDIVNESVPAGLPLAPVPGYWYATMNAWVVTVDGTIPSFSVTARTGGVPGPAAVPYVRDGRPVGLDVDGDGDRERLGYATRLSFAVTVPVLVVVPPGGPGVGDGTADERSPGWPNVGPVRAANVTRRVEGT